MILYSNSSIFESTQFAPWNTEPQAEFAVKFGRLSAIYNPRGCGKLNNPINQLYQLNYI